MRIILFSGKGGVGKTTLAAATAVQAAALGHRALVMSTDAAHSLGDSLALPIGPEPTRVTENLDAMEVDVHHELDREFGPIRNFLTKFFKGQGLDEVVAEEMAITYLSAPTLILTSCESSGWAAARDLSNLQKLLVKSPLIL